MEYTKRDINKYLRGINQENDVTEEIIPSTSDGLPPVVFGSVNNRELSPFEQSQFGQWWNEPDQDTRTPVEKAQQFVNQQREAYGPNPDFDRTPLATKERQKNTQRIANSKINENFVNQLIGPELTGLTTNNNVFPYRPEEKVNEIKTVLPEKPEQSVVKSQTTGKKSVVDNALQTGASEIESSSRQEDTFNQRLEEARQKDAEQGLLFGLLKAAQMGGAAIAGSKADTSFADTELEKGEQFVNKLKTDEALKTEHAKVLEEQEKRDPNSSISNLMRQAILALKPDANVQGLSAAQVEKIFPSLSQAINMREQIESRKELAQLQREATAAAKGQSNKFQVQTSVDKMVNNLRNSDDYKTYQATKAAQAALDNAIASGNKVDTGSAFMLYAKIAQGDNSVVRESDMKNLAGSYNYTSPQDMLSKLAAKAAGGNFSSNELIQMKNVASLVQKIKGKHVQEQLNPIRTRIEEHGLNANEIIDPGIFREFSEDSKTKSTTIGGGKVVSREDLIGYAKKHNTTPEQAAIFLKQKGYNVQQ